MKRIITLIAALVLALILVPTRAEAAEIIDSGTLKWGLTWELDEEGTLTISGSGSMSNFGQEGEWAAPWSNYRTFITTVVLEDGITRIGECAFYGCVNLTSVTIPESVREIFGWAFQECRSLTNITIPNGVEVIRAGAFYNCSSLYRVTIPESVKSMGMSVFNGCTALPSVTIPDGIATLEEYMFADCTSLTRVTLPDSIVSIGRYAFYNCSSLTAITLPVELLSVGEHTFTASGLKTVKFMGNAPLVFPFNVFQAVKANAYYSANNPTWTEDACQHYGGEITWIPDASIPYTGGETWILASGTCGDDLTWVLDRDLTLTISGTGAMDDFYSYDGGAPWRPYCAVIANVVVEEGITTIGQDAFRDCVNMVSVDLPDSLTRIESGAFYSCEKLAGIHIPETVTYIGTSVFEHCYSLVGVNIPDGITSIESGTFHTCQSLPDITIPDSVTSIGMAAFLGCNSFVTVDIPDSVTNMDGYTFRWCNGLVSIKLPPDIASIGEYTFDGCRNLTDISIPAKVSKIGEDAFNECTLRNVFFGGTEEQWQNLGEERPTATYVHYSCSDSTGHWNVTTVEATCVTAGYEESHCACGYSYRTEFPATGIHADADGEGSCDMCGAAMGGTRLAGSNRYDTGFAIANKLKENLGVDKFEAVVVAYGQNFPDALTGSYLAAVKNAPILLTEAGVDYTVAVYIDENLVSGGTVYILGGSAAVSESFEMALWSRGFRVVRLKGAGRYETNLAILREAGVNATDEVLIATGKNYADSLSASATGLPMLLVDKTLTDAQKEFLMTTSRRFVILGGTGAVSSEIAEQLSEIGSVTRVKGSNRYSTSVEIAKRYFENPNAAVLAYANGFPDGLCGGPLALSMGAPMILTSNESYAAADAYIEDVAICVVTGGSGRISDETVREIFDMPESAPITRP